jgi:hypothetical protein
MLRSLSLSAVLFAGAILSAVGCQTGSSCYDYARPVSDCQCGCCGCGRCGSAYSGCGCGGCGTCNCGVQADAAVGPTMQQGTVEQGPVQSKPSSQTMPQNGGTMYQSPGAAQ